MNGTQMERIPRLLQLISFMRNVGPLRVGPERSQRRLVAKFGGDMPHWPHRGSSWQSHTSRRRSRVRLHCCAGVVIEFILLWSRQQVLLLREVPVIWWHRI